MLWVDGTIDMTNDDLYDMHKEELISLLLNPQESVKKVTDFNRYIAKMKENQTEYNKLNHGLLHISF